MTLTGNGFEPPVAVSVKARVDEAHLDVSCLDRRPVGGMTEIPEGDLTKVLKAQVGAADALSNRSPYRKVVIIDAQMNSKLEKSDNLLFHAEESWEMSAKQ